MSHHYEFGADAVLTPESTGPFTALKESLIGRIQPGSLLESLLADEMLHASWELERLRNVGDTAETAPIRDAAANRATRNFQRAFAEIRRLQTARSCRLRPEEPALSDQSLILPVSPTKDVYLQAISGLPVEELVKLHNA